MVDPVNPTGFLFQVVSDLTGGMVTDIKTAMVGVVTLLIIMMGLDLFKDVFFIAVKGQAEFRASIKARDEYINAGKRAGMTDSEIEKDENETKFNAARRKYSSHL